LKIRIDGYRYVGTIGYRRQASKQSGLMALVAGKPKPTHARVTTRPPINQMPGGISAAVIHQQDTRSLQRTETGLTEKLQFCEKG
jgi:hypothetical protein